MECKPFDRDREALNGQYKNIQWIVGSGPDADTLGRDADELAASMEGQPRSIIRARLFEYVVLHCRLAMEPRDWFGAKLDHGGVLIRRRGRWQKQIEDGAMAGVVGRIRHAWSIGAYNAQADFGHVTPGWQDVLTLGVPGLRARLREARRDKEQAGELTREQAVFYEAGEIVWTAVEKLLLRLAGEAEKLRDRYEKMAEAARCYQSLAERPPETLYEALQLSALYFVLQENVEGERLRSMGCVDRLYRPFFEADLAGGRATLDRQKELLKYYLNNLSAMEVPFNLPLCLGGVDGEGRTAVNPLSRLILEAYDEIAVFSPKIHIRVHEGTPSDFLRQALSCIRRGHNSILFINDEVVAPSLVKVGVTPEDAADYVPIGCYEPAVMGREVACTGSATLNAAKAVELTLFRGADPLTGATPGCRCGGDGEYGTFDEFYAAVRACLRDMTDDALDAVARYEGYFMDINPAPLLSSTMGDCVERGRDAYAGGARYNNNSLTVASLGSAVDSLTAIRYLVYESGRLTLQELRDILCSNWEQDPILRMEMQRSREKWGNNRPGPDALARDLSDYVTGLVNNRPNARGGVSKAGMFSIDFCHYLGARMGAMPDGRRAREPLSKNLGAVTAMDREGVTALMASAAGLDQTRYPNGTVLDIMLHPSAVRGAEGLETMMSLTSTYFKRGGFAVHYNIMDADTLREAQRHPGRYANLQVRVCGWNVCFINLSKAEQDEFIRQADSIA